MNIFNYTHQRIILDLLDHQVDFIIVGGLSVIFHGYIRTTGDLDLWLRPSNENKEKLLPVLTKSGLSETSVAQVEKKDFTETLAFHFDEPPNKVDFVTHIAGLNYDAVISQCEHLELEGRSIPFLGLDDLIANKLASGRLKDQSDVEELRKIHGKRI